MEEMEGRLDADAHHILVQSAAAAQFNSKMLTLSRLARTRVANLKSIAVAVLRVWGGGMFLPDAFYDACDEFGIMLYHDMQYAQSGHSPKVGTPQDPELRYQIRRLSSHPSVAIVRRRCFSRFGRVCASR